MIGLRIPPLAEPEAVEVGSWSVAAILAQLDQPPSLGWRDFYLPVGGGQARLFIGHGWPRSRTPPANAVANRLVRRTPHLSGPVTGPALIVRTVRGGRGRRLLDTLDAEEVLALGVAIVLSEPRVLDPAGGAS